VSRFQFVADHFRTFEVKRLCQLVESTRSSCYAWAAGARVNHKRVARVMRAHHLAGVRLRRRVRTTIPEPSNQVVPDLRMRDFTATAPNTEYVGDITYLSCGGGRFLYLATVIDFYSRRLVGWSIADHMRTDLVADALRAAARQRGSMAGAIFHSDHGGQYTSRDFATLCKQLGVIRSMGKVGTSADNAMADSFNASLKRETLQGAHGWDTPTRPAGPCSPGSPATTPAACRCHERKMTPWGVDYGPVFTRRRHSTRGSSTTRSTRDRLPVIKQMFAAHTAQATSRAPSVM
jgi:transposase InsO family protein